MKEQERLKNGFAGYGLKFDEQMEQRFFTYMELLLETNKVMNLTAITEPQDVVDKHFLDSVSPLTLDCFPPEAAVIDVGCGAGFPGLPLKIARPDLHLTLMDALGKRVKFLQQVTSDLHLEQVKCLHLRAEEGAVRKELRQKFDVAVSRAVANMQVLTELCCAYVKVGGYFIALKGPGAAAEVEAASGAITAMGCRLKEIRSAPVPGTDYEHTLVVLQKEKDTPRLYPRNYGRISKHPLD